MPELAIVLTGAIVVSRGSTAVEDATIRRQQYLTALRFYSDYAPVIFLENTGYDLLGDPEFASMPNVVLRPIAAQDNEIRGKGYREFHTLDLWHENDTVLPKRMVKITGRYLYHNIGNLLDECRKAPEDLLLFDRYIQDGTALTGLFSVSSTDYGRYLRGLYREVNDPTGIWIEHVVYRALANARCEFFRHEPDIDGISGTSGQSMRSSRGKFALKKALRTANRAFNKQQLYFRGTAFSKLRAPFAFTS